MTGLEISKALLKVTLIQRTKESFYLFCQLVNDPHIAHKHCQTSFMEYLSRNKLDQQMSLLAYNTQTRSAMLQALQWKGGEEKLDNIFFVSQKNKHFKHVNAHRKCLWSNPNSCGVRGTYILSFGKFILKIRHKIITLMTVGSHLLPLEASGFI